MDELLRQLSTRTDLRTVYQLFVLVQQMFDDLMKRVALAESRITVLISTLSTERQRIIDSLTLADIPKSDLLKDYVDLLKKEHGLLK